MTIRTVVSALRPGDVPIAGKRVVEALRPVVGGAFEVFTLLADATRPETDRQRVVWHGGMVVHVNRKDG